MLKVQEATADGCLDAARADIAASFQKAVVDTLIGRTLKAADAMNAERIIVAGGVGANRRLRTELTEAFDGAVHFPRLRFCTDNGAMIAIAGAMRLADAEAPATIRATARWSLDALRPPGDKEQHNGQQAIS